MNLVVLDASALLAYLNREKGLEVVASALPNSIISPVNLAEVVSKFVELNAPMSKIRARLLNVFKLGLKVATYPIEDVIYTGELIKTTKKLGLSLGDRTCLSLGVRLKAPILTADKAWSKLDSSKFLILLIR